MRAPLGNPGRCQRMAIAAAKESGIDSAGGNEASGHGP